MNNIVKIALRDFILSDAMRCERSDALDEMIAGSIVKIAPGFSFGEAAEYRRHNGRIETIKFVRTQFACGLLEALIIVKGIESHYDIF